MGTGGHPGGIKIPDGGVRGPAERAPRRHSFRWDWNYRFIPTGTSCARFLPADIFFQFRGLFLLKDQARRERPAKTPGVSGDP